MDSPADLPPRDDSAETAFAAPIAEQIWDMKYRLKPAKGHGGVTEPGAAEDLTVEDSWRRVAGALAEVEAPDQREMWRQRFYEALAGFQFLPAGRILAGAGAGRTVTLFNCFVMGTIPDEMGGIFEMLKEAAVTMQHGGGIGYDFSTIRPKGAPVAGVGADASGPLSFMDVWDAMCRTIMSAGSRRGAMMATMRCDHPDVEAFIAAKADPARLRMFNLSVLTTDAFMDAVRDDKPWDLTFDGVVYKTLPARALWDQIMQATYDYAEPGVIFIDRINKRNNLWYCESISATNPCVTADSWVQTSGGPRQVSELIGRPFSAIVDGAPYRSGAEGFFATGEKPVVKLSTRCGRQLRLTKNHQLRVVVASNRFSQQVAWRAAGDLRPGDQVVLHDHRAAPVWAGEGTDAEGYLLGLLIGDGTLKQDKAVLSVWSTPTACGTLAPGPASVMTAAEAAALTLPHRADFAGWTSIPERGEHRLSLAAVKHLALSLGMTPGGKAITPEMEKRSSAFTIGALRGLFDSDGSVQGDQRKGVSVRLAQSELELLRAAQRMLARLGIVATIYPNRREAGVRPLPDGRGGMREYPTKAQHELVIAGSNLREFAERVGFADVEKAARLTNLLGGDKRALNRERFTAVVESLTPDGAEMVYDVSVPGPNAFDANGFYAHNCGEQPLPPYGACLLGSINLARLVAAPFTENARIDEARLADLVAVAVRMMDNVVDASRFAIPEQRAEAIAKRRIGLGVTGLADALAMLRLEYGTDAAVAQTEAWMEALQRAAYLASVALAKEKGAFPLYDREKYLAGESIQALPQDVREAIAADGIRNALLTSIAPTGTISLYAGNVSSGVEPVFAHSYTRKVLQPDGSRTEEVVEDYALRIYREIHGEDAEPPEYFVSAQTLGPDAHVRMQAAAQKYIDSAISKTINVPADISFTAFKNVYLDAYASGCKGCTTYRPNAVTGSVLSAEAPAPVEAPASDMTAENAPEIASSGDGFAAEPLDRPESLQGATYKLKWPDSPHAIYITLNDVTVDGQRRPFEVFINSKNMEHYAWTVALTRMISAVFRRGGDVSFVVEELKAVFDPRGGQWMGGKYVPSILAAIGGVIERHMVEIGFLEPGGALSRDPAYGDAPAAAPTETRTAAGAAESCPSCGALSMQMIEGCATCMDCGFSKCS
ncbi:MAG: ribonucleoside reductase [Rhodobacteraceae bacterium]|nr:ribonucleoside reductase [Paracoccaceae bacterium]